MPIQHRRSLRVVFFGLTTLFITALTIDLTLAWVYVSALTRPGCPEPQRVEGVQLEAHWLSTEDHIRIRVWYTPGENGAAILALGGIGGSLGTVLPPVEPLVDAGFGVLQIGTRACAIPPARVTLGADEIHDALAGLEFLQQRNDVDQQRIGVYGFSMGGVTAIRSAARHPYFRAILAEGGYANLGEHITQPGTRRSLPRRIFLNTVAGVYWLQSGVNPWAVSPRDDLPRIATAPVLLIYGEHEIARGGGQAQFEAANPPKQLWIVPDGHHGTNHLVQSDEYTGRVVEFFEQTLLSEP